MANLPNDHPVLHQHFVGLIHVARRSDRAWAGLSTDLMVERVLVRSMKTSGGLTRGRGMTEQQRLTWLRAMPACAEVNRAMQELSGAKYSTNEQKKKMNLFGYTYKIYDIGYKTEMMSKECNSGDPLETPGGLYRGPPSNENTIFKKMCMPNIKFKSVQCSFTMNVNQLQ